MLTWFVVGVGVVLLGLMIWWSARASDEGPGDELARKFRDRGGWGAL